MKTHKLGQVKMKNEEVIYITWEILYSDLKFHKI